MEEAYQNFISKLPFTPISSPPSPRYHRFEASSSQFILTISPSPRYLTRQDLHLRCSSSLLQEAKERTSQFQVGATQQRLVEKWKWVAGVPSRQATKFSLVVVVTVPNRRWLRI